MLDTWTHDYPGDFSTPGAAPALAAIVKSFATKSHLLHYTTTFLPFLEVVPQLHDSDALWAVKSDIEESDVEDASTASTDSHGATNPVPPPRNATESPTSTRPSITTTAVHGSGGTLKATRDRKSSLPPSGKGSSLTTSSSIPSAGSQESIEAAHRQVVKDLLVVSQELALADPKVVAEEITRQQRKMFLDIQVCDIVLVKLTCVLSISNRQPRDWLHFAHRYSKKDLVINSVAKFSYFVNHLAEWCV